MKLNNNLFIQTSIASLMVLFGVVTKNSFEQIKQPNHPIGKPVGMALFTLGWFYIAYILSVNKPNKILFVVPSLMILMAVMLMKQYMGKNQSPPPVLPLLFALGWIILGFNVGNHLTGNSKYLGLIASACVLVSMMSMLPAQRKSCVVDGPGMPLFTIAWIIFILLNSSR
jgi:hypothetical protein